MNLHKAALMIREKQKPVKPLRLYQWHGWWMVRNNVMQRTTLCCDFQHACEWLDVESLELLAKV